MLKHRDLTRKRLAQFASENGLGGRLYPLRHPIQLSVYHAPGRISYDEALKGVFLPLSLGEQFGPFWSTHWVRVEIDVPQEWRSAEVHLLWDSSSEACIWQDGQPRQGLTGSSSGWDQNALRKDYKLTEHASGGEKITLFVEVACNTLFGMEGARPHSQVGLLRQAEIAVFDRQAWDLWWDFRVIADMAEYLPANTPRGGQALFAANEMVNAIHLDERSTWQRGSEIAAQFLTTHNGEGQFNLSAVGHAHIDTAWLWPLAETRRKCIRTFSSALRYMEDYPDFIFACSQAQQYEWIEEEQPALFERIRQRVEEGRFIPAGGSWVEPDCNLPSGESLVRQFLFGQRFFQNKFGVTCTEFWEPDVFGYSAALPQILLGTGIRYFLTIKLSWNQFNRLPSNTFWWEGLDGSRVLTHFPPADNYNAEANVKDVLFSMSNFKDLDRAKEGYMLFGFGDGGGGPTPAMLEQIQRMGDVDGLPRVAMRTPTEFFKRCEKDAKGLTTWVGELYLEFHRGTYTTQARNKRYNRISELLLRDLEFLATMAHATTGVNYPSDQLNRLWKRLLTNQFHDIIPGSSIHEVYDDSATDYADLLGQGSILRQQAIENLVGSQALPDRGKNEMLLVVNTLDHPRCEIVELPEGSSTNQTASNQRPLGMVRAPALGYAVMAAAETTTARAKAIDTGEYFVLENEQLKAVFQKDGGLSSLIEKHSGRECIPAGTMANRFVLFDDNPADFDAWDVDIYHLEKRQEVPGAKLGRIVEHGPLRVALEFEYDLSPISTLKQTISLTVISARMDFTNEVEWHESHQFLKVEFPLDIRAQDASYEIQFGMLQRPTHFNTSWDLARFEVCAHKWADLSEPDFGITLFNDCKYGHSAHKNILSLSLLRSPKIPDPQADMGHHVFRYGLFPHASTLQQAEVTRQGYDFNVPLIVQPMDGKAGEVSFFSIDSPSVIIDTIKKAEDSDAIILRLYEAYGCQARVRLASNLPIQAAWRCNLLEEEDQAVEWINGGTEFTMRPFQIVTYKLITLEAFSRASRISPIPPTTPTAT
jgi:alpha-mannosidase